MAMEIKLLNVNETEKQNTNIINYIRGLWRLKHVFVCTKQNMRFYGLQCKWQLGDA